MEEKKLNQLNEYLKSMDLPFQFPLVEALIRNSLAARSGDAEDITARLYKLSDSVPPGEEASLLFEQLIFDLFKEQKTAFDRNDDELISPMRERLMTLLDRWTLLTDFLHDDKQAEIRGREEIVREMDELLNFSQGLLNRVNHPADEDGESLGELDFLTQQSEEVLIRIMEKIDEILNPPQAHEHPDGKESILTLKVSLPDLSRPVWRRIKVSGQITLAQFHLVLQKTMGWWDLYGHQFEQAGRFWGKDDDEKKEIEDEGGCLVQTLLEEEDDLLHYYYDLPEGWHHKIYVESVSETAATAPETRGFILECLDGAGACPPEDCGGPEGFRMLLASLKDDASSDLKADFAWVGDFNPDVFSVIEVNKELKTLL
ncbi:MULTISPECIES: plasmid pRiA4b ORF-3 family protein [unclassified Oceanispirochaeta]|uniref:plasmid pRiA4b ORF-3 family protein n=1 Tax=unclassified Oceanispirochaeta TaxID=2635722 RepID=UPI000E08DEB7|nr:MULTISPECIES: plasmid pRiA4b ORF-3 family protein [unclassified Oceanispirochaeta]MBF9014896.1 plasmid pRiA4b ORF-3 family protein [Oceanispirochaeta sp. M2]NPD71423.1 plasmid pRiA4b ORF-3 family protein [Oceanispirochaeta sp. M1]RDG33384.1 plasmid pRiA4b ORF-3 family protein [Oceanispirochaeta sp. M1]